MNPYVSVILTIAVCLLLFVLWIIYENSKKLGEAVYQAI